MSNDEELRHCLLCGAESSPRVCISCSVKLTPKSVGKNTQWRDWNQLILDQQIAISPDFTPTSLIDHSPQPPSEDHQTNSEEMPKKYVVKNDI